MIWNIIPKISVVIHVKNEAAKIERCLEAVFDQSYGTVGRARQVGVENAEGDII